MFNELNEMNEMIDYLNIQRAKGNILHIDHFMGTYERKNILSACYREYRKTHPTSYGEREMKKAIDNFINYHFDT